MKDTETQDRLALAHELGPRQFIAIGPFAWGRGDTEEEAIKNCKVNLRRGTHEVTLLDVPEGTSIDGMGRTVHSPPEGRSWPGTGEAQEVKDQGLTPLTEEEHQAWKPQEVGKRKVVKR